MSTSTQSVKFTGMTATTTAAFTLKGGKYGIDITGTGTGGTAVLQIQAPRWHFRPCQCRRDCGAGWLCCRRPAAGSVQFHDHGPDRRVGQHHVDPGLGSLMGKYEQIIASEPPAPRAPAVIALRGALERELADLKLRVAETALAAYEQKNGRERLAELDAKIRACTLQIESAPAAHQLAAQLDEQAMAQWRAAVQTLEPAEIVAGIGREVCPRLCGAGGGCCIVGSDSLAGSLCCHPAKEGLVLARYHENSQIVRVYAAAVAALKMGSN
jgi:hypothetical protein